MYTPEKSFLLAVFPALRQARPGAVWRWSSLSLLAVCLLAACAAPGPDIRAPSQVAPGSAYRSINAKLEQESRALDAQESRLPPEARAAAASTIKELAEVQPRLYSFRARQLDIRDALIIFARANGLNLISDPDLTGVVSVDFTDVPLNRAFEVLLSSLGYAWEQKAGVIRVRSTITRSFELDYIRGSRSGSASATGSGTGGGSATASTSLSDSGSFWQEIEQQLRAQLSPRGKLIINRLTGTVLVTDSPPKVEEIESFINTIKEGMNRQVDIEVRIVEVTLNDDFALGLDWSRLNVGNGLALGLSTIVGGPAAVSPKPGTFTGTYSANRYNTILQALKQQGDVRMVSQPRIRILNNQTAFVKVGTTDTFYARTNFRTTQQGVGVIDTINEQANAVNIGIMLTVTPQISSDGWTMLNVAPTVTRLAGTSVSPSGQSTAPILDVKEVATMVRARSGELVVLGGLIEEEGSKTTRALPGLGEIPAAFNPFRGEYKSSRRKEMVIFMMPTVISSRQGGTP